MWIKIDDHYDEHPKFAQVGPLGVALWLAGLAHCNRNLTDGFIPWATAHTLVLWKFLGQIEDDGQKIYEIGVSCGMRGDDLSTEFVVDMLVRARLWEVADGGYRVHDYLSYQPSKAQILKERKNGKQRAKRSYESRFHSSPEETLNLRESFGHSSPDPVPVPIEALDLGSDVDLDRKPEDLGNVPQENAAQPRWRRFFEEFWTRYPHWKRRSSRPKSISAWNSIKPRSAAMFEAVMAGLEASITSPDWQKNGGEFVPASERWIKSAGWDSSDGKNETVAANDTADNRDGLIFMTRKDIERAAD